jgi:hypothetical protein
MHVLFCHGVEAPIDIKFGLGHRFFQKCYSLSYGLQGILYHCQQMALGYAAACRSMFRIGLIPFNDGAERGDVSTFGGQVELYFELDALTAKARRTYDALGHVIWDAYGHPRDRCPGNFANFLDVCNRVPDVLHSRLSQSWNTFGVKLKDYRDCILHYTPLDTRIGSACMVRLDCGAWSAKIFIPDNPEARAASKFTFDRRLDALNYGWELTSEVIDVSALVADSIRSRLGVPD